MIWVRGALLLAFFSVVSAAAAAVPARAADEAPPGPARGIIRGRVLYDGPVPAARKITTEVNTDVCGAKRAILGEELVVSSDSGLANAVVILAGITERAPRTSSVELKQENCVFAPHVLTVTEGSQIVISNDDPVIHNVHARLGEETVFNLGMPLRGVRVKRGVGAPGVVTLQCDSGHTWMQAYVVVVPHSYHATSGRSGEFMLGDVLPGSYTLRTWHERLGVVDTPVVVKPGEETAVTVTFHPGRSDRAVVPALDFSTQRVETAVAPAEAGAAVPAEAGAASLEAQRLAAVAQAREAELTLRRSTRAADVVAGRGLFSRYCAACHGDAGNGQGEAAPSLRFRPRDFTRGEFKFRSTKSGQLPSEDDLVRTISAGIPGTDMPAWRAILGPGERRILARYVMSFSERFITAPAPQKVEIPPEPKDDEASIARGRQLYERLQCAQCHGADGRAEGVSKRMLDDWGEPIVATDLTRGVYKAGPGPIDRYRTLVTGLSGTPMPSFADLIGPDETWDLVHYLRSLAGGDGLRKILGVP